MTGGAGEALAVALLVGVLAFAVTRPRGWPEAVVAVPAAGLLVALGTITPAAAWSQIHQLLGVVGFLAAVLVLARLCDDAGLFRALGELAAHASGGRATRLLVLVFALASSVTAVLSLDATIVLLTPVVFATATRMRARAKPHVYACTHLANTASLLLPVSNLTNLLAFGVTHLSFPRFAALMALPWVVGIVAEYAVFRGFFAVDLAAGADPEPMAASRLPRYPLAVLAGTLCGFAACSLAGVAPAWAALAGDIALAVPGLRHRRSSITRLAHAVSLPFLAFVLALGIVVAAVVDNGLGHVVDVVVPHGISLPSLLAVAAIAAVLANLVNNLPAVLVLIPVAATRGTGVLLATLIGVNVGPNLTYVGSLATLLWRRVLRHHDSDLSLREFTALGALSVPATLVAAVAALWAGLRLVGV